MRQPRVHAVIDFKGPKVCFYVEQPKGELLFNVALLGCIFKGVKEMLLRDDFHVVLSVAPVDKFGNPAQVDGAPTWASSDESVATVTPSADGLSCDVRPVGKLGTVQISATADADLGDGVVTISGTFDIDVVAGQAVSMSISAGTPEPTP